MSRLLFTVELKLPPKATDQDALYYVIQALKVWRGGLEPPGVSRRDYPETFTDGDPMFNLDPNSVKVRFQTPRRRR